MEDILILRKYKAGKKNVYNSSSLQASPILKQAQYKVIILLNLILVPECVEQIGAKCRVQTYLAVTFVC